MHLSISPIVDYTSNALLRFLLPPPLLPPSSPPLLLLMTHKFIYIFNDMLLRKRCEWFRFNNLRTWVCCCCFFSLYLHFWSALLTARYTSRTKRLLSCRIQSVFSTQMMSIRFNWDSCFRCNSPGKKDL